MKKILSVGFEWGFLQFCNLWSELLLCLSVQLKYHTMYLQTLKILGRGGEFELPLVWRVKNSEHFPLLLQCPSKIGGKYASPMHGGAGPTCYE